MRRFFNRISYSFGNEDWDTERQALQVQPGNHVLCITASGDRPLHLLSTPSQSVVAVDANSSQNYLLDLKAAAMKQLDYEDYLEFLGIDPAKTRRNYFEQLRSNLEPNSSEYWQHHMQMLEKGVIYQGFTEKFLRAVLITLNIVRNKKIKKIFDCQDLECQKKFIEKEWDTPVWRYMIRLILSPLFTRLFVADPGLYEQVDSSIQPSEYIYDRLHKGLMTHFAKDNTFLSLFFQGKVHGKALPFYLTREGFNAIKKNLDRLSFHTADIIEYLEHSPANQFDAFSLSDVASYLNKKQFMRLLHAMYRAAKPGARFCIREFMSRHAIPISMQNSLVREPGLEKKLVSEDRCFVYNFIVGKIHK